MIAGNMESQSVNKKPERETSKNFILNSRVFEAFGAPSLFPENVKAVKSSANEEDLFQSFRGLLILGRVLGVIPICGVFSRSYRSLHTNLLSVPGITSSICISFLTFNVVLAISNAIHDEKKSLLRIAQSIGNPLFACWGCFIYVYFIINRRKFIDIFKMWASVSRTLSYTQKDTKLHTTIVVISVIMFTSTFLENATLHMEYFEYFDDINGHTLKYGKERANVSILHMYYWRSHKYWDRYLGYHPIFAFLAFMVHKWILYGWNYLDVTSALFFRALFFKFKALCKVAEESLLRPIPLDNRDTYSPSEADRSAWEQLARDHDSLCEMLNVFNNFFSPIIFVSYTTNTFFFCMQLLFGLNPEAVNHSIVHSIYAPWSFIHIVLRIFLFSLFASKINDYAHKIRDVVMRCPVELYTGPVAKLDKRVTVGPKLGMTGLGCFVISKPFMLSILNVVFTIEIVLLQGLASEMDQKQNNNQCKS